MTESNRQSLITKQELYHLTNKAYTEYTSGFI